MYQRSDRAAAVLRFEEIEVGKEAELFHTLTLKDVEAFGALTGDFNPLHVDEEYSRTTLFRRPVVYGMLSASFISTMIGMMIPGQGALWTSQTLQFLQPAFVGDRITVKARVKQKSTATRLLYLEVSVVNQHGQTLITGESVVKVLVPENQEKIKVNKQARTIVVTGGSRGIGAAIATQLAEEGHLVVINYVQAAQEAEKVVENIRSRAGKAIAVQGNVAESPDVERIFAEAEKAFGVVDDVVHCAAPMAVPQPFDSLEWSNMTRQLDVQLKGAFNCVKRGLPSMIQKCDGQFILMGSIFTDNVPPVQQTSYVVAKAALASFAKNMAQEYGPKGIRVNVVSPGMTQTDMIANIPDKVKMLTKMQTPLRRLADPVDIAKVVSFLVSPGGRHITGENIRVCGGIVMV